ncbi:hypothetical protein AVMA1855_16745 [Acidovorax sp. SUPP1855]|uniref:hypothetical protein n=1 Tax=Acidovorax sp. SUPP1855 TaxID=431774 RepID=UPI0023DE3B07|nr:hypothetical protein [Acidovorax sp. SUPP1855]GKS85823.1 hypothetical protein AVMA1855_16745 [Acidovorax sp. SUPP1855]
MTAVPITTNTHRCWPIDPALLIDSEKMDNEELLDALREASYQRRLMAHPDPRDPDHPEEPE